MIIDVSDQGFILIFNHLIDKIQFLWVMLLMVSLDKEQIVFTVCQRPFAVFERLHF